jgi:(p)ppGpp synthase/HD superfamily hydrolase
VPNFVAPSLNYRFATAIGPRRPQLEEDLICMTAQVTPSIAWSRLAAAITYALDIHRAQTRKGTQTPYIGHLLAVASIVLEAGGDEEQAMAGVLHDAVEDIGADQAGQIEARFGTRVAQIVLGCTDADTLPKPPWRARKEAYLAHLDSADADTLLVSCADKLHNARAIVSDVLTHGRSVFDRFKAGEEGTLWYYRALSTRFARLLPGPLARDLALAVDEMERLAGRP